MRFERGIEFILIAVIVYKRQEGLVIIFKIKICFFIYDRDLPFFLGKEPVGNPIVIGSENKAIVAFKAEG